MNTFITISTFTAISVIHIDNLNNNLHSFNNHNSNNNVNNNQFSNANGNVFSQQNPAAAQ